MINIAIIEDSQEDFEFLAEGIKNIPKAAARLWLSAIMRVRSDFWMNINLTAT